MREDKLKEAIFEIYRRAYRESDPPGDFDKMMESGECQQDRFFMNYYLSHERLNEIINEVCKEKKVKKWEKRAIFINVILGGSPTSKKP